MRRALGLALLLVVVTATPAHARLSAGAEVSTPPAVFEVADDGHGEVRSASDDDGRDGTDPAAFLALVVAGVAAMAAVAALVFARVRQPA